MSSDRKWDTQVAWTFVVVIGFAPVWVPAVFLTVVYDKLKAAYEN